MELALNIADYELGSLESRAAARHMLERRKSEKDALLRTRTRMDCLIVNFPRAVPKPRALRPREQPFVPVPRGEVPYEDRGDSLSRLISITAGEDVATVLTGVGGFSSAEVDYLVQRQMRGLKVFERRPGQLVLGQ